MTGRTKGRGGKRKGSGRKSKFGEPSEAIRVPRSLASWIKENLDLIREWKDRRED